VDKFEGTEIEEFQYTLGSPKIKGKEGFAQIESLFKRAANIYLAHLSGLATDKNSKSKIRYRLICVNC